MAEDEPEGVAAAGGGPISTPSVSDASDAGFEGGASVAAAELEVVLAPGGGGWGRVLMASTRLMTDHSAS